MGFSLEGDDRRIRLIFNRARGPTTRTALLTVASEPAKTPDQRKQASGSPYRSSFGRGDQRRTEIWLASLAGSGFTSLTFECEYQQTLLHYASQARIEIGGGFYHIVSRGNGRRKIFRSRDDYIKFSSTFERQKAKLPFFLYAYCLMPNHLHLLIEMQDDPLSQIMQRLLTTYSQYHNRRYRKICHLCCLRGYVASGLQVV